MNRRRKFTIAVVVVLAVLAGACTESGTEPVTTTPMITTPTIPAEIPDLEFGSGEVPFTVPEGFPLPDVAVVGRTMIDGVNGRTEMIVNFPANVVEVVAFYEANLPLLGFEVTDSRGTETEWDFAVSKDGVAVTFTLTFGGSNLSSGAFVFYHS